MLHKHFMMHLNKHQHTWLESSIQKQIIKKKKTILHTSSGRSPIRVKSRPKTQDNYHFLHLQL